jgi:hypothetical protein
MHSGFHRQARVRAHGVAGLQRGVGAGTGLSASRRLPPFFLYSSGTRMIAVALKHAISPPLSPKYFVV